MNQRYSLWGIPVATADNDESQLAEFQALLSSVAVKINGIKIHGNEYKLQSEYFTNMIPFEDTISQVVCL